MSKKEPKEIKAPKKRKHKGLKIFLIVLCIIIVLPIAFLFIAFFDSGTKNVSNKDVHYENLVSEVVYKGLEKLDYAHPQLSFKIDEEMIDGILMSACDKINQKQYIPKMYCFINDNNYTFVMDAQISFFKTRVFLNTSLTKDNDTLEFSINNITIGRLPIPYNWVSGLLGKFINDDTLNNSFKQAGFNIQSHLSVGKLTYSREQFKEDVGAYIEKMGTTDEKQERNQYLKLLLSMIGDKEHEVLKTDYSDGITATFDFSQLELTEEYEQPHLEFVDLDKHQEAVANWLNQHYISESDVNDVYTYLIRGTLSSNEVTTKINGFDNTFKEVIKSYLGGTELTAYGGSKVKESGKSPVTFATYCGEGNITANFDYTAGSPAKATFTVTTDSLNKYFAKNMTEAIGKIIPITYQDNNTWYFNCILVDNLYVQFDGGNTPTMTVYLTLNIAGIQIGIALVTKNIEIINPQSNDSSSFGQLSFKLDQVYCGPILIEDKEFLDPILDLLPKEGDVFYYDKTSNKFLIDLDSVISDITNKSEIISILLDHATPSCTTTGGTLSMTYTKNS